MFSKKNIIKIIGWVSAVFFVFVFIILLLPKDYDMLTLWRSAPIGTGYAAKMLCSGIFVSGRQPDAIWKEDLALMHKNMIRGRVDYEKKTVDASVFGFLFKQTAVFRGDCGCTLDIESSEDDFWAECDDAFPPPPENVKNFLWPAGDTIPEEPLPAGMDREQLERTLDWAFSEHKPGHPIRTRAVIVLYDGKIIAEKYAEGYSKETRFLGWSMTKSVTSALIGVLVREGKLDIYRPAPIAEWKTPGDPRGKITTDQLLRMSSGLAFQEEYEDNPDSDAGFMYFTTRDMASFAAGKPLEAGNDEKFNYSSGTTMLLSRTIREAVGEPFRRYLSFPRRALFNRLGMRSAIVEPDPSGMLVGAAFMYATARDWARFGLLYYHDGMMNGQRILPEGWVQYTRTSTPVNPGYGAQFWLNRKGEKGRWLPDCPDDLYSAWGYEGQFITIVPSRKTIIVRLGQTPVDEKNWDHNYFVSGILKAMPD